MVTGMFDGGVFARPEAHPYIIDNAAGAEPTLPSKAEIISATAWRLEEDGLLHGLWWDSPLGAKMTAHEVYK